MSYLQINPLITLIIILALAVMTLAWFTFGLYRKWNAVFGQRDMNSQDALSNIIARLIKAEENLSLLKPRISALEEVGKVAIQKVGFLRFNPFEHTGGDQSFAVALLDHDNNGVVISSLYTREGVRIYAKKIEGGISKNQLSDEERTVLAEAMQSKT